MKSLKIMLAPSKPTLEEKDEVVEAVEAAVEVEVLEMVVVVVVVVVLVLVLVEEVVVAVAWSRWSGHVEPCSSVWSEPRCQRGLTSAMA